MREISEDELFDLSCMTDMPNNSFDKALEMIQVYKEAGCTPTVYWDFNDQLRISVEEYSVPNRLN